MVSSRPLKMLRTASYMNRIATHVFYHMAFSDYHHMVTVYAALL